MAVWYHLGLEAILTSEQFVRGGCTRPLIGNFQHVWFAAMDDDAIIIVFAAVGAAVGALIAAAIPRATPELIVVGATACTALGTVAGCATAVIRKSLPEETRTPPRRPVAGEPLPTPSRDTRTRRSTARKRRSPTSKSFRTRLAEFTRQSESMVMVKADSYKSTMPFWSAVDFLSRVPPKSAIVIRKYLMAIHRAVRGKKRT